MKKATHLKRLTVLLVAGFLTIGSLNAQGLYFGGSIGPSFVNKSLKNVSGDDFSLNDNSFGYKLFGGYDFSFLGVETGYHHLGKVKNNDNQVVKEAISSGWELSLRAHGNVGPIVLYAKAGGFFSKSNNTVSNYDYTNNNSSLMWGLGAGLRFGKTIVQAEWEALDLKKGNKLSSLTVGVTLHIGGKKR